MPEPDNRKFRSINPTLGKAPKFGPFPADQIIPWATICFIAYWLCKVIFRFSWLWTGVVAGWGIATWWVLTGSHAWRFFSKFVRTPVWVRGYGRYKRILGVPGVEKAKKLRKK